MKMIKQLQFTFLAILFITFLTIFYLYNSNLFNDYEIEIYGNLYQDKSLIIETISPYINSSILSLDLKIIKSILESMDYIESVQISRVLPNILSITLIEREPRFLITKNNDNIFIDSNGNLVPADQKACSQRHDHFESARATQRVITRVDC